MRHPLYRPAKLAAGTAIITALFIMTLVSIAATAMSLRFQIDIYRTRLTLNAMQATLAAQAVQFWAIGQLKQAMVAVETEQINAKQDTLPQLFPSRLFSYPNVKVAGQLDDLQAKFNLNNLMQPESIPRFEQLLLAVDPTIKPPQAHAIAQALADWVTPYQTNPFPSDSYYTKLAAPYLAAHFIMSSISEFKLVQGVTGDIYQRLAPYICALPVPTAININTASLAVLQTLGVGLTSAQAKLIIQGRGKNGYSTVNDLLSKPKIADLAIAAQEITVVSNYFLATAVAKIAEQQLTVYNILKRDKVGSALTVQVIGQYVNTL